MWTPCYKFLIFIPSNIYIYVYCDPSFLNLYRNFKKLYEWSTDRKNHLDLHLLPFIFLFSILRRFFFIINKFEIRRSWFEL